MLLEAGANPDADQGLALICAIDNVRTFPVSVVRELLAGGASANVRDGEALVLAAKHGNLEGVRLLLAAGARGDVRDSYALVIAALYGHAEIVELLLAAGARADARNGLALDYARWYGKSAQVVELLLAAGATAPPAALAAPQAPGWPALTWGRVKRVFGWH